MFFSAGAATLQGLSAGVSLILRWTIKDKSGQKDENIERRKDNTQDSEGFYQNFNEVGWNNINKYELSKINLDKKTKRQKYEKTIHRTQKASRRIPMNQDELIWTIKDKLGL